MGDGLLTGGRGNGGMLRGENTGKMLVSRPGR
jgi:hypothetical protein